MFLLEIFINCFYAGNGNIRFQRIKEKLLQELSKIVKEVKIFVCNLIYS